jgi:hypothetical protein
MYLKTKQPLLLEKLFVWSVVLEPMLYFLLFNVNITGFGTNLSRLLQVLVIIGLLFRLLIRRGNIFFPNPINNQYLFIWLYFISIIFSTILGLTLFNSYDFQLNNRIVSRPIIEVIIIIYTIVYFIFFTIYFLKEKKVIDYFFKIFHRLFLLSFIIGLLDFGGQYFFKYDLISRHLIDSADVGMRFHGLFGEPRDAFGALMLWIAMFYLRDYWTAKKGTNIKVVFLIFIVGLLTFSLSAIVSIIFSTSLIIVFGFKYLSSLHKIKLFCLLLIVATITSVSVAKSLRLEKYVGSLGSLYKELSENKQISGRYKDQRVDVVPLWERWTEVREFNIIPTIIGTGIASSSFANMRHKLSIDYGSDVYYDIESPRSNFVRIFFDTGILGVFLFIFIFLSVLRMNNIKSNRILILTLILLGCFFAHRSYIPFIFLGVLISVIKQKKLSSLVRIESDN